MIEILIKPPKQGSQFKRVFSGQVDVNISKSIYEILEPDKRKSDLTKTIEIIGTPEADEVFMAAFDVNFEVGSGNFDPSVKAEAVIYAETNEVIRGYCQLTDVVITDENNHIYKITVYGQLSNLFAKIEDKRLQDLDFSDLDHSWNATNVQSNWTGAFGDGYQYPFVNWSIPTMAQNPLNTVLIDWRPFLYVFEIFQRIMTFAGVRWQSDFINNDLAFKKLIYRADTPMKRGEAEIATSLVNVARGTTAFELNATNTATIFGGVIIPFNVVLDDPNNQYNTTFFTTLIAQSGKYNFQGLLDITFNSQSGQNTPQRICDFELIVERSSVVVVRQPIRVYRDDPPGTTLLVANVVRQFGFSGSFALEAGDIVYLQYINATAYAGTPNFQWVNYFSNSLWSGNTIDVNVGSQMSLRLTEEITEGDTINVATMVAGAQPINEFLMGLVKMFNLYIDYQPDGSVLIEPYHNFYTNEVVNLTPLLAVDREFTIKPLEQSKYKFYQYKYKNGNNRIAKAHREGYGEEFGQTIIQVDNYFSKGVKAVDIPFKLLINANNAVSYFQNVIPYPVCGNPDNVFAWVGDGIPIIAYYGGMVTSTQDMRIFHASGVVTLTNEYPFAGYIDHPDTPDYDLCFDLPSAVYYQREELANITIIEDGQLYPQYHEDYIEELTNKNSKIVECYIKMDSYLYSQMTFRKAYFIRNAYYRLYEIEDFNPETNEPTKCVFLKIKKFTRKTPSRQEDWSDVTDGGGGGDTESVIDRVNIGDNQFNGSGLVVGNNNSFDSERAVVLGFSNQLGMVPDSVSIGFGQVFNDDDNWEYHYYGVEGSPFYIRNEGNNCEVVLHNGSRNAGKIVHISSTNGIDVKLAVDDSVISHSAGYHIYINFGGTWIKVQ